MTDFRILVTSSRTWNREDVIWGALDHLARGAFAAGYDRVVLVHGMCERGGDAHADAWYLSRRAADMALWVERHPANWSEHGKKAAYIRNLAMVQLGADVCLAAIRDESKGATMCAELAERAGIHVQVLDYDSLPERAS
jgi:hypothetical protein